MNEIQLIATFSSIPPETLEDFKTIAAEAAEATKSEAGTLSYDFFLNEDETSCIVYEVYTNPDAILAHMGNVGELLGRMLAVSGPVEAVVLGDRSAELVGVVANFGFDIYSQFAGK